MFIGHYGAGLALKRFAPNTSLGTLLLAALWLDIIWPVFILLGIERVTITPGATRVTPLVFEYYPFTHSLLATVFWAVSLFVICRLLKGRFYTALALGAGVLSHWLLDAIVHKPDLPIGISNASFAGMGLWNHPWATALVEGLIFAVGLSLYLGTTRPINAIGRYGIWAFAGVLVIIYAVQFAGSVPPNATVVAYVGLAQALLIIFGGWADRGRRPGIRGS
ncbi:MAG: hypothetical protein HZB85_07315 [Deltaproteobacteria bacterium]|nr:hypothetical protein [Deltaproteobacteria bacterium]